MANAAESIGILQFALDGVVDQQQVIANNIANQDTPGFQASEVSFESSLAQALGGTGSASVTDVARGSSVGDRRQQRVDRERDDRDGVEQPREPDGR